jgi:hypothetical protein
MDKKKLNELASKLRRPIHISYISQYILKTSEVETKQQLDILISEGLIKESDLASGYYVIA